MSVIEYDWRLQGAKRAAPWPTVAGDPVDALLVASPVTGHVLLADLASRVPQAASLDFGLAGPRSVVVDSAREEGWIACDNGALVRCTASLVGAKPTLAEQARATVAEPGHASWLALVRSLPQTGRRIAAGRAVLAAPKLGGTSSRLVGAFPSLSPSLPTDYPFGYGYPFYQMAENATWVVSSDNGADAGVGVVACLNRSTLAYTFLTPPPSTTPPPPGFGASVCLAGGKLFVGCYGWSSNAFPTSPYSQGRVFIYDETTLAYEGYLDDVSTWELKRNLGIAIASLDGNVVFVGANYDGGPGNGFVYVFVGGTFHHRFQATSPVLFGYRLHLSPDGAWLAVVNNRYGGSASEVVLYSISGSTETFHSRITNPYPENYFGAAMSWDPDSLGFWVAQAAGGYAARHFRWNGSAFAITVEQIGLLGGNNPLYVTQDRASSDIFVVRADRISLLNASLTETDFWAGIASPYHRPLLQHVGGFAVGTNDGTALSGASGSTTADRIIDVGSQRVIIAPVAEGTIAAFSTEGSDIVELSRLSGLTPRVEAGVYDPTSGYLYVVDSGGDGVIIELLPDNSMRVAADFQFPNVQGPVRAQVIDSKLYICAERRNRVLCWDLADPEAPVLLSDTVLTQGTGWEQNPIRLVAEDTLDPVRRFGSLPMLDHADYPVDDAGLLPVAWALHGEIGALSLDA